MHCLRWWLPIFLLPLPAASPILTLLFIATYAIRTRPCAYCSVIILGLMFSTCAFYSYEAPSAIHSAVQERLITLRNRQAPTSSMDVPAGLDVSSTEQLSPTSASSCWIDLTCGMLSSSEKSTNVVPPASELGWWSAPTRRRKPTVLRQIQAVKMTDDKATVQHASTKMTLFKPVRQWYDRLRSDGLWIGLGQDAGFRLKLMAD